MELQLPFVSCHIDRTVGAAYVRSASGVWMVVARCARRIGGDYIYEACPEFVVRHAAIMTLGNVLRWINNNDLESWLDRIIYLSFVSSAEEVTSNYWFMKVLDEADPSVAAELPKAYHATFEGCLKDKWILLKNRGKIWPVRTTDNRLYEGWDIFWNDHGLQPDCVVIFGGHKRGIFDVIILGTHRNENSYEWSELDEDLAVLAAETAGCEQIATLPGTLFARKCLLRFGFMCEYECFFYQAIVTRLAELLVTTDTDDAAFTVQTKKWIVPVVNHEFVKSLLVEFVMELGLCTFDFVVVTVVEPLLVHLLIFGPDGLEKPMPSGEVSAGEVWALVV